VDKNMHIYTNIELKHNNNNNNNNNNIWNHSRNSQPFMEPEGSSQCSKNISTGPYPEPDQNKPILSLQDPS
jgi:hypothetical protein